jgi:adenylate cyclase
MCFLAEAHMNIGQLEEARAVLDDVRVLINKTGEHWWESEWYRLKGELALQSKTSLGPVEDKPQTSQSSLEVEKAAEECFLQAIGIAQQQHAKPLELRAVMSLVRLWQCQAQNQATRSTQYVRRRTLAEGHRMLSDLYNWFTEGFDTADLQEAKALLETLSHF